MPNNDLEKNNDKKNNIAWVTGAEGFIGSHMVDFLLERNWKVIASVKPGAKLKNLQHNINANNPNFILEYVDMRDGEKIFQIIQDHKPNAIFHYAAQSTVKPSWEDPKYTIEVNVIGEIHIFEAIKKLNFNDKVKLVIACSSAEYGTQSEEELPLKETNHLRPVHPYGISKVGQELLGRQYWLNFNIPCVLLRFFNQTGPRKDNDACSEFGRKIAKIASGKAPPVVKVGNLETFRDITGIKDTIQASWLAYEKGRPGEVYNVCSAKPTKIRDVLEFLIKLSNIDIKIEENTPELLRHTDEPILLGDNSKIKEELGFKITQSINDVLRDIYQYWMEYYKDHDD
ncbi:MAG: GDP-mannose 4,6-dehydratase [Promethearchaeota archaeon]